MHLCISEEEREKAVRHLIETLPREILLQVYHEMSKDPSWLAMRHFGVGIEIRNLLRVKGFAWDDITLDREWEPIALEAVRRVHEDVQ